MKKAELQSSAFLCESLCSRDAISWSKSFFGARTKDKAVKFVRFISWALFFASKMDIASAMKLVQQKCVRHSQLNTRLAYSMNTGHKRQLDDAASTGILGASRITTSVGQLIRRGLLFLLAFAFASGLQAAVVTATYNAATDIPVTASSYTASGNSVALTLNFAPATGSSLTVVKNTGLGFISGMFSNLSQGQRVVLSFGGVNYHFSANYYGGTGNDLVLQWAPTRPVAWGAGGSGQLGSNTTPFSSFMVPTLQAGALLGKTIASSTTGAAHSLAVCTDGGLYSWGWNAQGQLGIGNNTNSAVPVAVSTAGVLAGKTIIAASGGNNHSLALSSDGKVFAWGLNSKGQLGTGNFTDSNTPVPVVTTGALSGKTVIAVSAGYEHSLALCSDGTLVAWGGGTLGQLGNGGTSTVSSPVAVVKTGVLSGKTVVSMAAGGYFNLALCSDGTLVSWGENSSGQLGDGTKTNRSAPVLVPMVGALAGKTVNSIATGDQHTLVLSSDGALIGWGEGGAGQLGYGGSSQITVPVSVDRSGVLANKTVVSVSAGTDFGLALCSDGSMAAWGYNLYAQLGANTGGQPFSYLPVQTDQSVVTGGQRMIAASTGSTGFHSIGLAALPATPQIAVEQPTGVSITDGVSTVAFLTQLRNAYPSQTFVIKNTGGTDLSNLNVVIDGGDSSDFSVVAQPAQSIAPGAQTLFTVRFKSSRSGTETATMHIISNVTGSTNPFDFSLTGSGSANTSLQATYNTGAEIPLSADGFVATGNTVAFSLNCPPVTGDSLTVVANTGIEFIQGNFDNLAQGQLVGLSYNGVVYNFVADYFGGTGNDLVLRWANTRPVAWGLGTSGQLGNHASLDSYVPVPVATSGALSGKTIISLASGSAHNLAVCSDGTVLSWGSNSKGQLGINGLTQSDVPVLVDTSGVLSGKRVIAVAAGGSHSLALCSDGTVATWGWNYAGSLGNGNATDSPVPVLVDTSGVLAGKTVVAIDAGWHHSIALCSDGTVVTWGWNGYGGQLGNNSSLSSSVPVAVDTSGVLYGKQVAAIAAGGNHNLVLCRDGSLVTWGDNTVGLLGIGSTTPASSKAPVPVVTFGALAGKTVAAISAGWAHCLVLCTDGTPITWGQNLHGELGNQSKTNSPSPVLVKTSGVLAGMSIRSISAGGENNIVLLAGGSLASWGYNAYGELGNNSTTDSTVPVNVVSSALAPAERFVACRTGPLAAGGLAMVASPPVPTVVTLTPTGITATSATLGGMVNANANSTTVSFEYGPTSGYGTTTGGTPAAVTGSTPTLVGSNLVGLTPGTTYHFRANATNTVGTTNGADVSFTTLSDNANLSSLVLNGGAISPNFSNTVLSYSATVSHATTSVSITCAAAGSGATITINGNHVSSGNLSDPITLSVGSGNEISATVLAEDGITSKTYTLTVTRLTAAQDWRTTWFGTSENAGNASDGATPDSDGIPNLLKYALLLSPGSNASAFLPQGESRDYVEGKRLTFVFARDPLRDDIIITVEAADDPSGPWTPVATSSYGAAFSGAGFVQETDLSGGLKSVQVRDLINMADAPRRFMHVKVSR